MKITVILCTYNRCASLKRAMESVAISKVQVGVDWEVLVVDNNSSDQTHAVVEELSERFPNRFRYLFESNQGKSHALNAGIRDARGDVLAFMDDDVTVSPTWLENLTAPLRDKTWAGTGGRIILQWPSFVPGWLSTDGPYARHGFPGFDQGDEAKELSGPPFGTNMAFRRTMFERHGGFRTDLGPSPENEIRSEDTEFGRRLISSGERLHYEPSAVVYHPVPQEKMNKKHFLEWCYDKGRADAREFHMSSAHVFFSLAAWTIRWMVTVGRAARFHNRLIVWEKAGTTSELFLQKRKAKQQK